MVLRVEIYKCKIWDFLLKLKIVGWATELAFQVFFFFDRNTIKIIIIISQTLQLKNYFSIYYTRTLWPIFYWVAFWPKTCFWAKPLEKVVGSRGLLARDPLTLTHQQWIATTLPTLLFSFFFFQFPLATGATPPPLTNNSIFL